MNRRLAVLIYVAFSAVVANQVQAQKLTTVGPNQSAPTTRQSFLDDSTPIFQSFTIPRIGFGGSSAFTYLRLLLWFEGSAVGNDNYYTLASFTPDPSSPQDGIAAHRFDQSKTGFQQWIIRNPGVAGQVMWLYFSSDFTPAYFDNCQEPSEFCSFPTAYTQVTSSDTYAGGGFWNCEPLIDESCQSSGDMLFSAELHVTPEPATVILFGTGALGLGLVALRRRRKLA